MTLAKHAKHVKRYEIDSPTEVYYLFTSCYGSSHMLDPSIVGVRHRALTFCMFQLRFCWSVTYYTSPVLLLVLYRRGMASDSRIFSLYVTCKSVKKWLVNVYPLCFRCGNKDLLQLFGLIVLFHGHKFVCEFYTRRGVLNHGLYNNDLG